MPQNDALGSQGAKRDSGVFERLALFYRGRLRADQAVSAPRLFAASSNEVRVRVLDS